MGVGRGPVLWLVGERKVHMSSKDGMRVGVQSNNRKGSDIGRARVGEVRLAGGSGFSKTQSFLQLLLKSQSKSLSKLSSNRTRLFEMWDS